MKLVYSVFYVFGFLGSNNFKNKRVPNQIIFIYLCFIRNFNSYYLSICFFIFILALELCTISHLIYNYLDVTPGGQPQLLFYSCFLYDLYSLCCKFFIFIFFLFFSLFSERKFIWNKPLSTDIFIPIFFFIFFSLFLVSAFDLFTGYLALEGVSLALYTLTANTYHKRVSIEAAIKYFVFGGVSNGLFLFGSSLFFGFCGSLNYIELKYLLLIESLGLDLSLGIGSIIMVFLFKVAAFPCHQWSPDVYEGVWLPITAVLIVLVKLIYFFFFLKLFFFTFIKLAYLWQPFLLLSSLGSLFIGSFGIIGQNRIKRLMAFSSINHVSFLLLGMACGTLSGLVTTLLYLIVYSLTLFFFFCILLNINCLITGRSLIYLSDFANLTKISSFGSVSLLIILFSMGGLPPLAGFFVKLYIYIEAISSGFFIFVFVSLVVTIISTFYYLFFLKSIFFDKSLWSKLISLEMSRSICIYIIVAVCLFLVGFMFIIPFIYTAIVAMSCSLYSPFWYIYLMLDVSFLIF